SPTSGTGADHRKAGTTGDGKHRVTNSGRQSSGSRASKPSQVSSGASGTSAPGGPKVRQTPARRGSNRYSSAKARSTGPQRWRRRRSPQRDRGSGRESFYGSRRNMGNPAERRVLQQ